MFLALLRATPPNHGRRGACLTERLSRPGPFFPRGNFNVSLFPATIPFRHLGAGGSLALMRAARTRARPKKQFRPGQAAAKRCMATPAGGAAAWRAQWRNGASTPSWRRARGRSSPRRCAVCATALWAAASPAASPKPRAGAKIGHEATNGPRGRGLVSGADDGGISSTRGLRPRIDNITTAAWF